MKQKFFKFFNVIASWPNNFSILEIFILLTGIGVGIFMYLKMNQIRTDSTNASSFDRQTSEIILSINLAYIHFDELMTQTAEIDPQKDIYVLLDNAEILCQNLDQGGPSGKFVPLSPNTKSPNSPPPSICDQVVGFRSIMVQRWQDHLDDLPDSSKTAYIRTYTQLLQDLQRFASVADPQILKADIQTKRVNFVLSIILTSIFSLIVFILWHTRKTLTKKNVQLEHEITVSSQLNADLDTERNLLNTLLDALPDAVFAKNTQDLFLIANPAAAKVMGQDNKEALVGKSESDFQPEEISANILADDRIVFNTGEPIINKEEVLFDLKTGNPRWRQTNKVPLHDRSGKIIGLVGISRDITKQKEMDDELQKTNAKLVKGFAALEQSTRETEFISQMVDLLQACPNTEEACVVIADQMGKFFPDDSGALYLFHSSRNILDQAASWGSALHDSLVFKPDDCWGLRRGKMHIIEADSTNFEQPEIDHSLICPHVRPDGPADYLCVPLVAQSEALGLLHLRHKEGVADTDDQGHHIEWYSQIKRQRIQSIIDSLSLSLANLKLQATLRQQSIRDPLTGLYNRRYMEETLDRELLRAARNHEPLGVVMLDIDHFKDFNDTFGHQAGDVLLQSLGHFFLSHIRGEDVACRYGGEEFILLLPGSTLEQTRIRAEEMREKAHHLDATFRGQSLGAISLSFGISIFPDHGTSPEILIQIADQALYRAKSEGRDRVIVA